MELITPENSVFAAYAWYSALLAIKMLGLAALTGITRFGKKVFCNPEGIKGNTKEHVKLNDPDVDRVRRAHLKDVENNTVFWIIGLFFVLTNPHPRTALNLFRMYFVSRVLHSFVYAIVMIRAPARGLAYIGGLVTLYMILHVMLHQC